MEIYNEGLYDLLDPTVTRGAAAKNGSTAKRGIEIKEHPTHGVYVQGLQEIAVSSHAMIQSLMEQGNEMRAVAATNMNAT
eukprot:4038340-Prymnesium_polylepis.1